MAAQQCVSADCCSTVAAGDWPQGAAADHRPSRARGGGTAAVNQASTPAPESKKPAPTAKEIIAKGQDVKAITEQARDLSMFGRDFVKVITGDWVIGGLLALGVLVFAFPKIREKLSA